MMQGIGASPGLAWGKVFIFDSTVPEVKQFTITDTTEELKKLDAAVDLAEKQIRETMEAARANIGEKEAEVFGAHLEMLQDVEFLGGIREKIQSQRMNASWAVDATFQELRQLFEGIEDEYLRERVLDLKDITQRLLGLLAGVRKADLAAIQQPVILAAIDLMPSDTVKLDKEKVLAFVTEQGGRTSHTSIMAKTLGIPAVVSAAGLLSSLKEGDTAIVYGDTGQVIINPSSEEQQAFADRKTKESAFAEILNALKGTLAYSKDGVRAQVSGNIGTPEDVTSFLSEEGEGVGLFRSEFLYMGRDSLPTEEQQYQAYREAAQRMKGKPVIIRTLDIGGDKKLPYLEIPPEENPFLGYRAIRLCLEQDDIFRTQLRALLRAGIHGHIKIMLPMISCVEELRQAKAILQEEKEKLRAEKIAFQPEMELGIMIEIPSAAVISDILAKECDFFSIGTNDLIQYTVAVDRMNGKVSHLYSQYHPALLRLIKTVIDNGHAAGIHVGMCGEVASDELLIPLLLGMGLDEFSMSPAAILKAKWMIQESDQREMAAVWETVGGLATAEEVKQALAELPVGKRYRALQS